MKKIITLEKPHDFITIKIKGDKDGELYRRAVAGDVAAAIIYLCAYCFEKWTLDNETLRALIRMERDRWTITRGGYTYNAAAA